MEICRMDKPSPFYTGTNSQQIFDPSYDIFSENEPNTSSYHYNKSQHQTEFQEFERPRSDNNWRNENVECKQEIDSTSYMQGISISENSNYGSESEFNEPYQYAYNPITPLYATDTNSTITSANKNNVQQHRMGPYHISSTKSQLPTWYHPPPSRPYYAQQPTMFQHQYPYQGNFAGAPSSQAEPNMRNMIHLTSRYFILSVAIIFVKN